MQNHHTTQSIFEELMSELIKKSVNQKKINQLCLKLNIPFNGDILDLMTYVLGSNAISNLSNKHSVAQKISKTKKISNDINL